MTLHGCSKTQSSSIFTNIFCEALAFLPVSLMVVRVQVMDEPDKGQYGLQAGQFASAEQAGQLGMRIKPLRLQFALLDVVDQTGKRWTIVAQAWSSAPRIPCFTIPSDAPKSGNYLVHVL